MTITTGQQRFGKPYIVGTLITFQAKFTYTDPVSGAIVTVDPTTVLGEVKTPDGVTKQITGIYRVDVGIWNLPFLPTQNGVHLYRVIGTGAVMAASEGWFIAETDFQATS